jgi:membrane associated rhomboid family serine protease
MVVMFGGLGVWLFAGPNTVHVGASGLIFGYVGYVLARGFFERNLLSIVLAAVVAVSYGGALWGLLPGQPGVSWEGHVFGFAAGVGAAKLLSAPRLGAASSARA